MFVRFAHHGKEGLRGMAKGTKIVINALQYRPNGSGIAVNLRELFGPFTRLTEHKCQIVLPKGSPVFPCDPRTEVIEAPCTYDQGIRRILFQTFRLGRYCKPDATATETILLTIDSKVPFFLPKSCKVVPLITDLAVFRMAETYKKSRVLLWRLQYRYLCKRADRFLAISEFTKSEITKILGIPPEKIDIIPCAASDTIQRVTDETVIKSLRARYNLPEHYILFVGNFNPRKNLERLIRAFDILKGNCDAGQANPIPHHLVIAGGQGWKFNADEALKNITRKEDIHFIGYVPDEDMPALYSAADLFAFPTLYEGFGIPVIEAQRCGTPVLTSNISALPDTGGEGAVYADPYDAEDIAEGISRVLADETLRTSLIEKGHENAKRFLWEASALKLNEIIKNL
jgi:glycosyltransferase involved in cell wall biosynthesis